MIKNQEHSHHRQLLNQGVLSQLPNLVFWKDRNLIYQGCNNNAAKFLGLPSSQAIIGKTDYELCFNTEYASKTQYYDQQVLLSQQAQLNIEELIQLNNGTATQVLTDKYPLLGENNEINGVLIISSLKTHTHLLDPNIMSHILGNLPQYIYWKNSHGQYIFCNEHYAKFVGLNSATEIIGKTDADLNFSTANMETYQKIDAEVLAKNKPINQEETIHTPEGQEKLMLLSKIPLRDEITQRIRGVLGIYTDISQIKQAEYTLKESKEKVELISQAKSNFIASMSHDLRTPLNSMLGAADILRIRRLPPEQQELVAIILKSGQTLQRLIEDILTYSKFETGAYQHKLELFDLQQATKDIVNIMDGRAQDKGLALTFSYSQETPRYVISDQKAIQRIITNLIDNSIKFTDTGSIEVKIGTVTVTKNEVLLRLSVQDTGIGIPEDKLESIFERFTRVEPSYKSQYEGLGLGLSIVKQLTNNLGGDVHANSIMNQGSIFYCSIPFKLPMSANQQNPQPNRQFGLRCLIVDDNKIRGNYVKKQLNESCCVSSSKLALNKIEAAYNDNEAFKVVIIDDEITSDEPSNFVKEIRRNSFANHVMIIIFTKPATNNVYAQYQEAGINKHFVKPVLTVGLQQKISTYWKQWQTDNTPEKTTRFDHIKVLLVEDDVLSQKVCGSLLQELGCDVELAHNGQIALEKLSQTYDLIFMDIGLDDISGLTVTRSIRQREQQQATPPVPIVALTAHASEQDKQECLAAGMTGFLTKPVMHNDLQQILVKLFGSAVKL